MNEELDSSRILPNLEDEHYRETIFGNAVVPEILRLKL